MYEALEDNYFRGIQRQPTMPVEAALSTLDDREHLYHGAVRMMLKHSLPFIVETSKDQVAEAEQFVERFLMGQDTSVDWLRIGANKRELTGDDAQPDLLGVEVPGALGKLPS